MEVTDADEVGAEEGLVVLHAYSGERLAYPDTPPPLPHPVPGSRERSLASAGGVIHHVPR